MVPCKFPRGWAQKLTLDFLNILDPSVFNQQALCCVFISSLRICFGKYCLGYTLHFMKCVAFYSGKKGSKVMGRTDELEFPFKC